MIIDIDGRLSAVNLGATGLDRIAQRVRTILSTAKGTVPLDRAFGVDAQPLDKPLPAARALMTAGIVAAIEAYEPMAQVLSVSFTNDGRAGDGVLTPVVRLKIKETADVA